MQDYVVQVRRALHAHPELSGQEHWTQGFLLAELKAMGIETLTYPDQHAVVGLLTGAKPGPTLGIRADMDALPVQEDSACATPSENPGVMHACGHDAHMAILLGVAQVLSAQRDTLEGNLKLLFEPAEETYGGAQAMIAAGCMASPRVDAMLGLHMSPDLPVGSAMLRPGPMSGSSDGIAITIRGKVGHGAYPHRGVDAILIAAQVVSGLQALVSRETSPFAPVALTLGTVAGGTAANIICGEVMLTGTLRALHISDRRRLLARIEQTVVGIAQAMGGEGQATLSPGYPALINHPALTQTAMDVMARHIPQGLRIREQPSLGVESFSYFCQDVPGVFYDLGCGVGAPLHACNFFVDEACLPLGVKLQVDIALAILTQLKAQPHIPN